MKISVILGRLKFLKRKLRLERERDRETERERERERALKFKACMLAKKPPLFQGQIE